MPEVDAKDTKERPAESDWHAKTTDELASGLETDIQKGLDSETALRRLEKHGGNELREAPRPTFLKRILSQFKNFIVILLIVASVVSALLGDWIEAAAIMAIVILNAVLGVIQEGKAEEALAALKKMAAPDANVIRNGHRMSVPAREIVPGDLVQLEAGNFIPADVRLVESVNLKVDEAALTGESVPVEKKSDSVLPSDASLGDRRNSAFMSTMVTYGRGQGIVISTGMDTEIGKIAEMIESYEEEQTPLQIKLNNLGRTLGIACLAICALVFVVAALRDTDLGLIFRPEGGLAVYLTTFKEALVEVFIIAVSLAIAAVPEGLPAIVTICLALGMREMVKRHALIRKLPAVETLGSATAICSDKTGTLTQNEMMAVRLFADSRTADVTGRGYNVEGDFTLDGKTVRIEEQPVFNTLLWGGTLCNDADLEQDDSAEEAAYRMVGDPTEGALVVAAAKAGLWRRKLEETYPRVAEVPFDSDRKRMSTIHEMKLPMGSFCPYLPDSDMSPVAIIKGAPDLVLDLCTRQLSAKQVVPLETADHQAILDTNSSMAKDALRVLAVAYRKLDDVPKEPKAEDVEKNLVFVGLVGMIDPARPEVAPAVAKARHAGIRTAMVTGDYADTARAIAGEIGILRSGGEVLTGHEINEMSDEELTARSKNTDVYARVSPEHKVRIVEAFKSDGHIVAMTGDGVNDAPALKRANIGVAMGITGTDVTKQTADMVLTDDNYVSIVSAVEQGRIIYSNIRKFVYFLLSCNLAEIAIIFIATLLGWPVPLTAIQLLWLNLLSDGAPALALGLEKGDPDIMERPPRPPKEPVINKEMILGFFIQTIAITGSVLLAYWLGMLRFGVAAGADAVRTAQTMAFSTLVLSELARVYTSRSERYPLFKLGIFSNKWMQYAVGLSVGLYLLVVYVPFLRPVFNTISLTLAEWGVMLPLIFIPSVVAELTKWLLRAIDRRRAQKKDKVNQ